MAKGKRYDSEPKLNLKKVFGAIIAIAVLIMIITSLIKILKTNNQEDFISTSSFYACYENGKWGVIDNNGEIVIKTEYDEMIAIPNHKQPIFVCTFDINEETGDYKTKVLNDKNEELFLGYDKIEAIDNYDSKQNIWFEDNLLKVLKDGKYGLINFNGNEILKCEYDNIYALKSVTDNIIVEKDGKKGLINNKGQKILNTEYSDIRILKEGYKNEYIVLNENGQYGLISTTGAILFETKYEDIKYINSSEVFATKSNNVWQLTNTKSEILQTSSGEEFISIKGDNIIIKNNDKYGVRKLTGEEIIPVEYEDLKNVFTIYYLAKKDGKYGIININNEIVKEFEYINMYYVEEGNFIIADKTETETIILDENLSQKASGIISEINKDKGYIKIFTDNVYKYYNFKFEEKKNTEILTQNTLFLNKKDGKYGYTDKVGNVVVDYIYEDATEQNSCGFVSIKQNGVWGSLRKNGAISCNPSVNLDENIYIDFIGKWHLSADGLYYTK